MEGLSISPINLFVQAGPAGKIVMTAYSLAAASPASVGYNRLGVFASVTQHGRCDRGMGGGARRDATRLTISLNKDSRDLHLPLAEINVAPLVDVMPAPLIMFMDAAPLPTPGVKLNPPKAASATKLNPKEPLVVSIGQDGKLYLGADEATLPTLARAVIDRMGDDRTQEIYIRGDKATPFGEMVTAMDRFAPAGVDHIANVTAPGAQKP